MPGALSKRGPAIKVKLADAKIDIFLPESWCTALSFVPSVVTVVLGMRA